MSVKVEMNGEGLSFTSDTTFLKAAQIIAFIKSETPLHTSPKEQQSEQPINLLPSTRKPLSPGEAVQASGARTNPQKILVFANYIITQEGGETFESSAIRLLFKKAGEPEPKNFSRDWKDAINARYIYEPGEKNIGMITNTGETILQAGFSEEPDKAAQKKRSSYGGQTTKRKVSQKVISENVKNIEAFVPIVDGLPNYHQVKVKGYRILWILAFLDRQRMTEVPTGDIEYIADKLRDKIPTNSLTALSDASYKKGYLTRTADGKYKLLQAGLEFITNYHEQNTEKNK